MLTGHRPKLMTSDEQLWAQKELKKTLKRLQMFHGIQEVISGMALGADTWWAEAAVEFGLPLASYVPFEAQADVWSNEDKKIWKNLRNAAHREVVLGTNYDVKLLHARNDAMIKDADLCVALWKESLNRGGTYSAVMKIRKQGKPLVLLDPERKTIATERLSDSSNEDN